MRVTKKTLAAWVEENLPSIGWEGWKVTSVTTYMNLSQDAVEIGGAQGYVQLSRGSDISGLFCALTLKGFTKELAQGNELFFRRNRFGGDITIDVQPKKN